MKILLLMFIFVNSLFATYNITCKGDIGASTLYDFYKLPNSSYLSLGGETFYIDGVLEVYSDIDTANFITTYYDDTSPVCGGSGNKNILIDAYCDWKFSDSCWDVSFGYSSVNLLERKNNMYINNVIIVNNYPCMPRGTSQFSLGAFNSYNHEDIGIVSANLSDIDSEYIQTPTKEEAKAQRETCLDTPPKLDIDLVQYVDDWENLLSSQISTLFNLNSKINLNSYDFDLNNLNLDNQYNDIYDYNYDLDSTLSLFTNNYKSSIQNSFIKYSNIFGIGDYGSAPTPINFNLLGKTYSAFDVRKFDEQIPFIRLTLLSFSYVWGSILILKMSA